jgi:2-alkenal reductase
MRVLLSLFVIVLSVIGGGLAGYIAGQHSKSSSSASSTGQSNPITEVNTTSSTPMSWEQVATKAGPAVVTIINQQAPQQTIFGEQPGATDEGSGFIIDSKGDIVTNYHVIDQEQSLTVVFSNGKKVPAQLVRGDPFNDLAVVRIHATVPAVLHFGNSAALTPGEPVMAIGSALGQFRNTVTAGVVSALGRTIQEPSSDVVPNGATLHDMVQTDAAINQGNSGGPLLNTYGQVIGINTAITRGSSSSSDLFGLNTDTAVAEGLGFAIASNTARNVVSRLMVNKPTASLGVKYQQVDQQAAQFYSFPVGAYIQQVEPNSAAAKAGLKQRDIITKVNGTAINDESSLEQIITSHAPGQTVKLTVWRNGKTFTISVKLGSKGS